MKIATMTIDEAKAELNVSERWVRTLLNLKIITCEPRRQGKRLRIHRNSVLEYRKLKESGRDDPLAIEARSWSRNER